jgi:hypothetical protein
MSSRAWTRDALGTLTIQQEVSGKRGELRLGHHRLPIDGFRVVRPYADSSASWKLEASLPSDADEWTAAVVTNTEAHGAPSFRAVTSCGTHLRARLSWCSRTNHTINGEFSEIDEWEHWENFETERIFGQAIEILLSPALPVSLPNTASSSEWAPSRGWRWLGRRRRFQIALGGRRFRLSAVTREFTAKVGSTRARVEVPVAALRARTLTAPYVGDPKSLFDDLRVPLGEALALLSLLQRTLVSWTEMSIHTRVAVDDGASLIRSAWRYRREDPWSEVDVSWGALVDPALLSSGDLDQMLGVLRGDSDSLAMRRSIYHLIESRRRLPLHHALIHSFTALEALVGASQSGLDEISNETFEALRERLRREIKAFAEERGLGGAIRAQLYGKLIELQRSPLISRVTAACEALAVDPTFLWMHAHIEPGAKVADLVREAYARRSRLIHAGYIEDARAAVGDLIRVRALAELLLFLRLGGDERWLRPFAWGDATAFGRWYSARFAKDAADEDRAPWEPFG